MQGYSEMTNSVFETIKLGNLNDIEFFSQTEEPLRKFHNWIKQQLIFESKRITNGILQKDIVLFNLLKIKINLTLIQKNL